MNTDTPGRNERDRAYDGELDYLYVRIERFASVLQEKYGLSRKEAMRKIGALKRAQTADKPRLFWEAGFYFGGFGSGLQKRRSQH